MSKIKLGIIGIGNMGSGHASNIEAGSCPEIELVAIADNNPDRLEWAKGKYSESVTYFDDAIAMLDSGLIDSCLIAVPHYDHCNFAIECMKRN
ncbi:MAG: Gfo/Idh/MocA family oxidoreductase, partial [Acutalibacteraceae bacterium]|nr:Gfo/Idh/MocA family oxidoreductase [Acutalibacteraceae bacterium]